MVVVMVWGGIRIGGRTVLFILKRGSLPSPFTITPPPYLAKHVHRQHIGELQRAGLDQQVLHKKFVEDAGDHLALYYHTRKLLWPTKLFQQPGWRDIS